MTNNNEYVHCGSYSGVLIIANNTFAAVNTSPNYTITIPNTNGGWITKNGYITWVVSGGPTVAVEKKKNEEDGCTCKRCRNFSPFAEANREDGSFICFGCRTY